MDGKDATMDDNSSSGSGDGNNTGGDTNAKCSSSKTALSASSVGGGALTSSLTLSPESSTSQVVTDINDQPKTASGFVVVFWMCFKSMMRLMIRVMYGLDYVVFACI